MFTDEGEVAHILCNAVRRSIFHIVKFTKVFTRKLYLRVYKMKRKINKDTCNDIFISDFKMIYKMYIKKKELRNVH
jgi:hypothetical protein